MEKRTIIEFCETNLLHAKEQGSGLHQLLKELGFRGRVKKVTIDVISSE